MKRLRGSVLGVPYSALVAEAPCVSELQDERLQLADFRLDPRPRSNEARREVNPDAGFGEWPDGERLLEEFLGRLAGRGVGSAP